MLHSLGDAVAAVGGDTEQMKGIALAIGQIQSKGKLSAEEVNQLAERRGSCLAIACQGDGEIHWRANESCRER
ncbi:tape measure protein [Paenibacillus sp. TAB 01]|uniref:tape measure protein n=1 Tax=Paenibacillus sp. TAB 01 TaxID=3368988 RepID=UPI0037507E1C